MCRLAYIPGKAKVNRNDLTCLFEMLEKSCGGDGNGYFAVSPTGEVVSEKGLKLDANAIIIKTWKLIRQGWDLYFHTRKVSVGWKSDSQCHPFRIDGKKFQGWLCHNGTWRDGIPLANYLGCGSDTAALAKVIGKFGIEGAEKRDLFPSSGVFLIYGSENGETPIHRVIKKAGDLQYCPKTGIWASEFDNTWPNWSQVYTSTHGKHLLCKPAPQYVAPAKTSKVTRYESWDSKIKRSRHNAVIDTGIPAPWDEPTEGDRKLWERLWPEAEYNDIDGGYPKRNFSGD
jgi:hypothetical protein